MINPFTDPAESYRFDSAYRFDAAGRDIGRPQTAIKKLVDSGYIQGSVIDIGCGTGEHTISIARSHPVLGIDFSPAAIESAKTKSFERDSRAEFLVWDALKLSMLNRRFDTAVDSACYHTLDQEKRDRYAEEVYKVLNPGGVLFLLGASDSVPVEEVRSRFRDWDILFVVETVYEYVHTSIPAYLYALQRP